MSSTACVSAFAPVVAAAKDCWPSFFWCALAVDFAQHVRTLGMIYAVAVAVHGLVVQRCYKGGLRIRDADVPFNQLADPQGVLVMQLVLP